MTHYSGNWTKEDQKEADRKWYMKGYYIASKRGENNG